MARSQEAQTGTRPSMPVHFWPCARYDCLLVANASLLDRACCRCRAHCLQKKLREQIGQNRCSEKNQPNLEQRLEIHISGRFGELIRNYAGERVSRLEERRRDLRRVANNNVTAKVSPRARPRPRMNPPDKPFLR